MNLTTHREWKPSFTRPSHLAGSKIEQRFASSTEQRPTLVLAAHYLHHIFFHQQIILFFRRQSFQPPAFLRSLSMKLEYFTIKLDLSGGKKPDRAFGIA